MASPEPSGRRSRAESRRSGSRRRSGSGSRSPSPRDRRRASESRRPRDRPSRSRSRSRSRNRSRSRSEERRSRRRRRRRDSVSSLSSSSGDNSSSSESSASSSDSDSSSSSDRRRRRKHKTKRSSSSSKDSRRKKDKKAKKKKEKKKKKASSKSLAVNQNEYGKYGILRESDFHAKAQSFQAWLRDVKKVRACVLSVPKDPEAASAGLTVSDFNGPKWEAMELFKEYMEDFNTATLPHEKYYDIEAYEMRQYQKKQQKLARRGREATALVDEAEVRRQREAERRAKEQEAFQLVLQTMDKDKIDAMRQQEQLRAEMQLHYKAGNVAEARRLEQLLRAEDARK
ncbi:hypothetical protein ATCC90586_009914 [Pythium insidiosum]|nr:hypothetical protein ATCC90586_009914 [Pythium insidiosum]